MKLRAFLLVAASAGLAQQAGLVREVAPGRDGNPAVFLRNTSTQAMTAWNWAVPIVTEDAGPRPMGGGGGDAIAGEMAAIAPGALIPTNLREDAVPRFEWAAI
jgi:hypothetical protein